MAKSKWIVDPSHSEIGFKVKHLAITNVSGSFGEYEIEVLTDGEDFGTSDISAKIKTASVNTNNTQRDEHLRNKDFFDVEKFPDILFKSTSFESSGEDQFILDGYLTLKGVKKPVKFIVEYSGVTTDPWGGRRAGFIITGRINRNEFGLNFNSLLDSGSLALAENVKILCEIQMVKQTENAAEVAA